MSRVLLTGASRGLGAALARAFTARGDAVVAVARNGDELRATVASIPGAIHALVGDVADKDQAHRIAGAAAALIGPIDLLVLNHSTLGPLPMPLLLDTACEDLAGVLETNLVGPFRLIKAVACPMALHGGGTVVGISSDAAMNAYAGWGAYGVSKAALDHLLRSFAAEVPEVRFLSFDPGEMDTRMHRDAVPDADPATLRQPAWVAARILPLLGSPSGSRIEVAPSEGVA